jgi:hypothetical protein
MREEERTITTVEHGVFGLPSPDWNEEELEDLLRFDEVGGPATPEAPPRRLLQNLSHGGLYSSDEEKEHESWLVACDLLRMKIDCDFASLWILKSDCGFF